MRNPKRIDEVLFSLGEIWKKYPDLRLGQLINNIEQQCSIPMYYIEDNELIKELQKMYLKEEE